MAEGNIFEYDDPNSIGEAILAVVSNDLEKLKQVYENSKTSIRQVDNWGRTPLHFAAQMGFISIVNFLLEKEEADINDLTHPGNSPLHYLCDSPSLDPNVQLEICRRFLRHPEVRVNDRNLDGFTPILLACKNLNVTLIKLLARHGADIRFHTNFDLNALHIAIEGKQNGDKDEDEILNCVKEVIKMDPTLRHQRSEQQLLPYQTAIIYSYKKVALHLISLATDDDITRPAGAFTALSIAASRGLYEVVAKLLERGADANKLDGEDSDMCPLQMACLKDVVSESANYPATVKLLCQSTKRVTLEESIRIKNGPIPYEICFDNNALDLVKILLDFLPPNSSEFSIEMEVYGESTGYLESPLGYFLRTLCNGKYQGNEEEVHDMVKLMKEKGAKVNGDGDVVPDIVSLMCREWPQGVDMPLLTEDLNTKIIDKRRHLELLIVDGNEELIVSCMKKGLIHPEDLSDALLTSKADGDREFFQLRMSTLCVVTLGTEKNLLKNQHFPWQEYSAARKVLKSLSNKPQSLSDLSRNTFRKALLAGNCRDLRKNPLLKKLPSVLQNIILFDSLSFDRFLNACNELECSR